MAHVCKVFDVDGESRCLHWMVLRSLSSCGVLESTILDLDPIACGDLGLGTHSYGVLGGLGILGLEPTHMVVLWPLDAIWSLECCSLVIMHMKPIRC